MATARYKAPSTIYLVEHRYGYNNGSTTTKYVTYDTVGPARAYRTKAIRAAKSSGYKYHHVHIYETPCNWTLTEDSKESGFQELLTGLNHTAKVE